MPRAGRSKSHIHAVLLAAGTSSRYGDDNKLLAQVSGKPLVRHVAEQLLASRINAITVVAGYEDERVRAALAGLEVEFTHNPSYASGLASSLRCGVERMSGDTQCAMIVLADMPRVTTALINDLIAAFEREGCEKIVFPVHGDGTQGNPVLWPRRFFAELKKLEGDQGAKSLIAQHADETFGVPVGDERTLDDIDYPQDLAGGRENKD